MIWDRPHIRYPGHVTRSTTKCQPTIPPNAEEVLLRWDTKIPRPREFSIFACVKLLKFYQISI